MENRTMYRLILILFPLIIFATDNYEDTMTSDYVRMDFYHSGNADTSFLSVKDVYVLPDWYGPRNNRIDPFNNGKFRLTISDSQNNAILYVVYFNSLFGEWQTTANAKTSWHTMEEVLYYPMPKSGWKVTIEANRNYSEWILLHQSDWQPDDIALNREHYYHMNEALVLQDKGDPAEKIDLAILAEGYTMAEKEKFIKDATRLTDSLFVNSTFRKYRDHFNIWLVFVPSAESGTDNPRQSEYKQTAFGSSFNTFGSQRYLMTEDLIAVHDGLIGVPHDQVYLLVNHAEYGGGAILNYYNVTSVDDPYSAFVFIHEFGHGFGGLADEYYTSDTGYDEFYPAGIEPPEPNITANPSREKLKWGAFVKDSTPVPTPWNKDAFDAAAIQYGRDLTAAKNAEEKLKIREKRAEWLADFYKNLPYGMAVGAYEGAGYQSKGLFRPTPNCLMLSRGFPSFCPVCDDAIRDRIFWYIDR
jgi:hypothetical protein